METRNLRIVSLNASDVFAEGMLKPRDKQPKPAAELDAVARTLRELDGDVVALQEVQSREALDATITPRLPEGAYPYRTVLPTDPRGIHNAAVLSKYPIACEGVMPPVGTGRGVGVVEIQVPGFPIKLYNIHFKANPYFAKPHTPQQLQAAKDMRMAEAHALKDRMGAFPSRHYVVAGDMNTTPDQPEIGYLLHGGGPPLKDPLEGRDDATTWSHPVTEGRYDYVMVDPDMRVTSARVVFGGGSDHGAVVVDVEMPSEPVAREDGADRRQSPL